ncbi:glycosyltransferase [Pedobacter deserti]|uniref:glycosyltransferase n=1 Tax=Pedobacter deserti TaxID=2817382 RepID=UPI00210A8CC7|nr:glycosyltransferase [Pedobacter sp. SYSU D00382]
MSPTVSVLMCVYNETKFVDETLRSILTQSYRDFEFIIVVDNPEHDWKTHFSIYDDNRIRIYYNDQNIGLTKSLNVGLRHCFGKYVARIDADDIALNKRFEIQVKFLEENPEVDVLGTPAFIIDEHGNEIGRIRLNQSNHQITRGLLFKNQIVHPSVMIRREKFAQYGQYNETFKRSQDYELWLNWRKKVQFRNLEIPLLKYRRHTLSITQSNNIGQRISGIEMMHAYVSKSNLTFSERLLTVLFFLKQFFKLLKLTYKTSR